MTNKRTLPIILIAIGVALIIGGMWRTHYLNNQESQINTTLRERKQLLQKYKQKAYNPFVTIQPKTPAEKNTDNQLQVNHQFFDKANAFFNVAFTFNSQHQWDQRSEKASQYATNQVLTNKNLFNSGKDGSGHSIIAAEKVVSTFNDLKLNVSPIDNQDQTVTGIAQVTYSGSIMNTNSSSHTDIYLVKYDLHQQKLTNVARVGELSN